MNKELLITSEQAEERLVLRLEGDITKTSGEQLLRFYNWDLDFVGKFLLIDFSKVNYINSAGIAYIIRLSRILNEKGIVIRAFGLEYHYEKMFQIVGLTKYLTHYPSEWAASENLSE
ncbi:STAS domain-containing protein [Bacillus sp. Marseille-P3661]|uniref:STAS domain-containing protein n=1 Tax=Bacillus sp. Marseille-P3661 TaxID=1936234 RepID=UPI000C826B13|nr:STAS domain-containing protein [Bacillus sp. Marseille-P3661]